MIRCLIKKSISHIPTATVGGDTSKVNEQKSKEMDIETVEILASELENVPKVKKIRKDKGLIERAESSKTIITEENKMLLVD